MIDCWNQYSSQIHPSQVVEYISHIYVGTWWICNNCLQNLLKRIKCHYMNVEIRHQCSNQANREQSEYISLSEPNILVLITSSAYFGDILTRSYKWYCADFSSFHRIWQDTYRDFNIHFDFRICGCTWW